jgi:hypothetical protein
MSSLRFRTIVAGGILIPLAVCLQACRNSSRLETINVSLASAETYQYPTVGGDEDGARISTQAKHYSISEIRRNAATNWVATYVYQPLAGFVGADSVGLEILTGSDGASPPMNVKRVQIHFLIHN